MKNTEMTFIEKARRFYSPIVYNPWPYIRAFIEGSTDGIFTIATLIIFEKIARSLEFGQIDTFYSLIWIYAGITILYALLKFTIMRHWGWSELHNSVSTYCADTFLRKYISGDPNYTERIGTGRFISIYEKGNHKWQEMFHHFLSSDLQMLLITLYAATRMFFIGFAYGMGLIVVILIFSIVAYCVNTYYVVPSRKKRTEIEIELTHRTVRLFMSKNEFLQTNAFAGEFAHIVSLLGRFVTLNRPLDNGIGGLFVSIRLIGFLLRTSIYLTIGVGILEKTQSFASFGFFILLVSMIEMSLRGLFDTFRAFTRDIGQVEKLWTTFDKLPVMQGYSTGLPFIPHKKNIEISSISYGYNETKVFDDFSLTIKKGQKTALVGASGGGKTTLMKLIAGYLHPDEGSISVLGNKLDETALKSYYPHIGYLTQDPGVFDATIRENLVSAIAAKNTDTQTDTHRKDSRFLPMQEGQKQESAVSSVTASVSGNSQDEPLIQALKLAQCDFVFDLEKGIDTEIGERGIRLSGGQKQRLAIAKIFLKNPEIILLDEPTSALDSFSEEKITEALDTLFKERTVIIIAHRLQTVKRADDIIVIEGGEVVERGAHEILVTKGGIYARMLELQSGF